MNKNEADKVLIFGYSDNPERYSNMAYKLLGDFGHKVTGFNPRTDDPLKLEKNFHTLSLYVGETISNKFEDLILSLNFKRIIFNPGSENSGLEKKLSAKGVEIVHGCTLVMLRTDQF